MKQSPSIKKRRASIATSLLLAGASFFTVLPPASAANAILNASYDVTRELFKEINPAFVAEWKKKTGESVTINQSHGGSSKQARSVIDGLEASVVTMNQANDIDILAEKGLVPNDWAKQFPNNSAPFYSTMVFLTRKGNPKHIATWEDLGKSGIKVIIPNPKTSGNGRYSYLAAWGSVIKNGGNEAQARQLVERVFKNVPVLDAGGRGATTTFTQRDIGDVLVTFENEVQLVKQEFGDNYDVVYPKTSILAESPVAVVDKVVDKLGTRKIASAYLQFLYSEQGQDLIAKHYLRPRSEVAAKKYASSFKPVSLFTVEEVFGGWKQAQKKHFDDGAEFDKIYQSKK
ncbi:sulfate ABC transporter substrate-binding protein [Undibacterium sp. SXout7W]|uniref:sulfate ABC transporter substrate-binding protein n=1 Tax=Undibacterium sp. SXout7W TaxID=3413049 RepID=UPI003BF4231E